MDDDNNESDLRGFNFIRNVYTADVICLVLAFICIAVASQASGTVTVIATLTGLAFIGFGIVVAGASTRLASMIPAIIHGDENDDED
jgi:hypothetical protein